jgi:hypothetical protein
MTGRLPISDRENPEFLAAPARHRGGARARHSDGAKERPDRISWPREAAIKAWFGDDLETTTTIELTVA